MRERLPRAAAVLVIASCLFAPLRAEAQAGLDHLEDASTPARGFLRLRAITAFTRYDARFVGDGMVEPLGAAFTADSLGAARVAALASIESLVESATDNPFRLTLGRSTLNATAREEIVPVTLEYGVTDRLSFGVVMPIVRKRVAIQFLLDPILGEGNVGPNPGRTSPFAAQNNSQVAAEFANAAALLESRLQFCQQPANQNSPGCPELLLRQSEAQELLQSSRGFATTIASLYGSPSSVGMPFVPRNESAAQTEIALRIADFNIRYQDFLATSTTLIQAVPAAAMIPAGSADFQRYLTQELGRDSLVTRERIGWGDMEIGVKFRVLDKRAEANGLGLQLAVASSVRLPTGSQQSPSEIVDLRLSDGSVVVDSRAIFDAQLGRFGLLAAARLATAVSDRGELDTPESAVRNAPLSSRNTRVVQLQVAPRWHLSGPLAFHGAYTLRSTDNQGGDQLAGGGVSFSTLSSNRSGSSRAPIEMRFTHLQAIAGDAGRPKFFRDQLEVRIYYRARR